jgi:DNA-binding GntR family transcriptional regulator
VNALEQPRLRSKVKAVESPNTDFESLLAPRPAGVPVSLSDQAYKALEELLVTAKLAPGSIWSEPALSTLTGFGRSPVREALQRLTSDHLVVPLRRHGFRITEVQVEEQLLVLEGRRELERLVSVFATRRASASEREIHFEVAKRLRRAGHDHDTLLYLRLHFALKRFTAASARNPFIASALSPLHALSRRFFFVHRDRFGDLTEVACLHADLAESIGRGDPDSAASCCDALTGYAVEFTRHIVLE